MLQRIFLLISLLILSFYNLSFRWPLDRGKITSTFGESRWDHFHDGVDIISSDIKVYPVDSGKLVYYWDRSIFPLENYPGSGNYKIIEHEGGDYSVYMHLKDNSGGAAYYSENEPLGYMGNTGHSFAAHLHFSIIRGTDMSSVNPLLKLPQIEDKKEPLIKNIALKINEKVIILKDRSDIRLTKHYPILVRITDSFKGMERLGIYKLKATFNKREILNINFDRIELQENELIVGSRRYDDIYDEEGYYKIIGIRYKEGINKLKIFAADFFGNSSLKEFIIKVHLDMQ